MPHRVGRALLDRRAMHALADRIPDRKTPSSEPLSPAEQPFARTVSNTSQLVRSSCQELLSWPWYGDFAAPPHPTSPGTTPTTPPADAAISTACIASARYCGCLRKDQARYYRARTDQIRADLAAADIDAQRAHVRRLCSRPGLAAALRDPSAALAILATLPAHARLLRLLAVWAARLAVLGHAPALAHEVDAARAALALAWRAVGPPGRTAGMLRAAAARLRAGLERRVDRPARRLRGMAAALDGLPDRLPGSWICVVEGLERELADWVALAEARVLQYEHRIDAAAEPCAAPAPARVAVAHVPGAWRDSVDSVAELLPVGGDASLAAPDAADVVRAYIRRHVPLAGVHARSVSER